VVTTQVSALKTKIQTRGRTLLKHIEPIWPKQALDNKTQGSVTMSFSINTDGSISDIKVIAATPKDVFNDAAITALSQWQYAKLDQQLTDIKTKFDFIP
jgi:TonB family protein